MILSLRSLYEKTLKKFAFRSVLVAGASFVVKCKNRKLTLCGFFIIIIKEIVIQLFFYI